MAQLTMDKAKELLKTTTHQSHMFEHALAVSAAMGAMAKHFDGDEEHWRAVGFLHDYDFEMYPEEHLQRTADPLREAGVDEVSIRAILAHGWGICSEIKPETPMEKALFTVDAASALVGAAAKVRPTGITDMAASSVTKKFKDKSFAATVSRNSISQGAEMLGIERAQVFALCIEGMKEYAKELGLLGRG